ncbi:hypothetical protein AgCh_020382 [Apium graveolens]
MVSKKCWLQMTIQETGFKIEGGKRYISYFSNPTITTSTPPTSTTRSKPHTTTTPSAPATAAATPGDPFIATISTASPTIVDTPIVLVQHLLQSIYNMRGQGYDGASNMCDALMVYKIFFLKSVCMLIISSKRLLELQTAHGIKVGNSVASGERETGKGLNQIAHGKRMNQYDNASHLKKALQSKVFIGDNCSSSSFVHGRGGIKGGYRAEVKISEVVEEVDFNEATNLNFSVIAVMNLVTSVTSVDLRKWKKEVILQQQMKIKM